MVKKLNKENGITLIALVITIIIMLILVGVSILTFSENGIINKTILSKEISEREKLKEKLNLIILDLNIQKKSSNENVKLADLSETLKNTSDITVEEENYSNNNILLSIKIKCDDKYTFMIDSNLKITDSVDATFSKDLILAYNTDNLIYKNDDTKIRLKDHSENNIDSDLLYTKYTSDDTGLIFDGSKSYSDLNTQTTSLTLPATIAITAKWEKKSSYSILFIDSNTNMAVGIVNNQLLVTADSKNRSYKYDLPTDFYKKTTNTIIQYSSSDVKENKVFVDGIELSKSTLTDYWILYGSGTFIGKRFNNTAYFQGTLYDFKIYNGIVDPTEVENAEKLNDLQLSYSGNKSKNETIQNTQNIIGMRDYINNKYDVELSNVEFNANKSGIVFNRKKLLRNN